jgi:hypothetical protein
MIHNVSFFQQSKTVAKILGSGGDVPVKTQVHGVNPTINQRFKRSRARTKARCFDPVD